MENNEQLAIIEDYVISILNECLDEPRSTTYQRHEIKIVNLDQFKQILTKMEFDTSSTYGYKELVDKDQNYIITCTRIKTRGLFVITGNLLSDKIVLERFQ